MSHNPFYRDIRETIEKAPAGTTYFKCGGCYTDFETLKLWRDHLIENAFIQCIKENHHGNQSVLSFYATKCRLNAIQGGLDQIIKKDQLLSFRVTSDELEQVNEKFNDSYKFILGENNERNFYFICPECNTIVQSKLKIELGKDGKDARTNSNSFLQVIWDHFKLHHTEQQPHAWKLYEKSCENSAGYKMFPCFGCQVEYSKINDWNMHKFSRSSPDCPYHFQNKSDRAIPMVIQVNIFCWKNVFDRKIKIAILV